MSEEKRLKEQIEEQKARIESLEKELEKHKGALADEEAIRRLKMAEETIEQLQKNLAATKQVQLLILSDVKNPNLVLKPAYCKTTTFQASFSIEM